MIVPVEVAPTVRQKVASSDRRTLGRALARAAKRLCVDPADFGIRIVDDREMARLNAKHRGGAGPTDVLSFPAVALPGAARSALGDVVLDWDAVRRQAGGRAVVHEAIDLAVHGLVHLLGHEHDSDRAGARSMLRLEKRACRAVGLPPPSRPYGGGA